MIFSRKLMMLVAVMLMAVSIVPAVTAQEDGIESLCLITDLGRVNDGTFNQFAHEGAVAVSEDYDLDYDFIETVSEADYESNIQTCVNDGADAIVTVGFLIQDATVAAAEENPDIFFIGVDQFIEDGPTNFVGLQFNEDQAGFVVGVLAGMIAFDDGEDVIAGVYGIDVPAVKRFRNGYEQGALFVNEDWEIGTNILGAYADSFVDQAQGISLANQFIGEGAYVIFGAGGPLGSAAIAEAASQGIYVIGVDQDEYFTTFAEGETDGAEFLISSAIKRVDLAVYDAVSFLAEGDFDTWDEFGGGNYYGEVGSAGPNESDIDEFYYDTVDMVAELLFEECISTNVDPVSGDLLSDEEIEEFEPAEGCDALFEEFEMEMDAMMEEMEMEEEE
ncbi:MAG: BMP family ABC transporter substrate-binding protein [Anaerolineae bacterium]